ncbi:magnesium transporter ATPase [Escherichia coli]|uniref:Magnesium transporter ATPase n=1 Tax=Escherichia coli TaxID=562 RepID=A0A3S4NS66_ECOLX|nr:magnesium transporter ATPase [Escherichia coli]
MRGKGAGLRTHVLIGMGSALFMIVSKYGFADVLSLDPRRTGPSRIAAQVGRASGLSVQVTFSFVTKYCRSDDGSGYLGDRRHWYGYW